MSHTYQSQLVAVPLRFHTGADDPQPEIIIGGKSYQYQQIESVDWDAVNQVPVNRTDNAQCR